MPNSKLTIPTEEKGKVNGKVYCSKCKCYMSYSTLTSEELKKKLEETGTHNH